MRNRRQRPGQHGAIAVLVALLLVVLLGAAGIALDLGRLFVVKAELQNAADACALAAVRELNMLPTSLEVLTRAENAGITVGNRHRADFQHAEVLFVADQDVTFSTWLTGPWLTKASAPGDVGFVRCTRRADGLLPWFMQALGAGPSAVGATAVASLTNSAAACGIPLGMCAKTGAALPCQAPGVVPDRYGLCKGQWYNGRFEPGGDPNGNFNWLDFTPQGGGAQEVGEALSGAGICGVQPNLTTFHAETGNMQSAMDAWNSRFGLYRAGGSLNASTAPPDYTGYSYGPTNWPQGRDAYPDYLVRQNAYLSYGYPEDTTASGNLATGLNVQAAFRPSASGPSGPHARGTQRRVVTMPVVDCSGWDPAHEAPARGFGCGLLVRPFVIPDSAGKGGASPGQAEVVLEYLGPADEEGSPCATEGLPGGPTGIGPKVPSLVQ